MLIYVRGYAFALMSYPLCTQVVVLLLLANVLFAISGDIFTKTQSVEVVWGSYRLTYCVI